MEVQWYKTKSEALEPGYFIVARDVNSRGIKEYARVKTQDEMSGVIDNNRCVYEVVTSEWKEMYDFDGNDVPESADEIIANFISCHQQVSPEKVHVKRCISKSKLSLHFVIPATTLPDHRAMKNRFRLMMSTSGLLHMDKYDESIYTKHRLIRTVRSDKCFQNRFFTSESADKDLFVSSPVNHVACSIKGEDEKSFLHEIIHRYHLDAFKPHAEINPGVFRIMRTRPSMCIICHRQHENDHAYIDVRNMTYGCFRDRSRVLKLDSDVIQVSKSKLETQLSEFNISKDDIENILSRVKINVGSGGLFHPTKI